jgi:hypothetical protein
METKLNLSDLRRMVAQQNIEEPKVVEKPSLFSSLFGILICLTIFVFTFVVIGLYMACKLPVQEGKLCYFEQYRTVLK